MRYLSQDPRFLATPVIARALRSPSLTAEFMTFRSITARVRTPDHAIDLMIDRTRAQSKEIVNLHQNAFSSNRDRILWNVFRVRGGRRRRRRSDVTGRPGAIASQRRCPPPIVGPPSGPSALSHARCAPSIWLLAWRARVPLLQLSPVGTV